MWVRILIGRHFWIYVVRINTFENISVKSYICICHKEVYHSMVEKLPDMKTIKQLVIWSNDIYQSWMCLFNPMGHHLTYLIICRIQKYIIWKKKTPIYLIFHLSKCLIFLKLCQYLLLWVVCNTGNYYLSIIPVHTFLQRSNVYLSVKWLTECQFTFSKDH